jgi:GH15 family glucan-1,4-alpha-glucosidase
MKVRDQIYKDIMERGWSPERKAFVQAYDSDTLDASSLIMPLVFFLSPKDPRMLSTLDAIDRSPGTAGWFPTASSTATTSK